MDAKNHMKRARKKEGMGLCCWVVLLVECAPLAAGVLIVPGAKQSAQMMLYRTLNPATEELVREYPTCTDQQLESALQLAGRAFHKWRRLSLSERAERFEVLAANLEAQVEGFAELMAMEMGKPLAEGQAEIWKCAWVCRYFKDEAEGLLASSRRQSDGREALVRYDPLGPVLAIMPWNFPFWQALRFAAPGLMAGNVALLKHAPNTPGCALALEKLFAEAGFSQGVFQNVFLSNDQAARAIADPRLRGVTLTGSTMLLR